MRGYAGKSDDGYGAQRHKYGCSKGRKHPGDGIGKPDSIIDERYEKRKADNIDGILRKS